MQEHRLSKQIFFSLDMRGAAGRFIKNAVYSTTLRNTDTTLPVVLGVGKPDKRKMISNKSFWNREALFWTVLIFNFIEITGVIITSQVWYNWWHTYKYFFIF